MRNLTGSIIRLTSIVLPLSVLLAAASSVSCGGPEGDPDTYAILFTLTETPDDEDLQKLSFEVEYDGGDFAGNGDRVACELIGDDGDLVATDDDEGRLIIAIDSTAVPLEPGDNLVECNFVSSDEPIADEFLVDALSSTPPVMLSGIAIVVTATDVIVTTTTTTTTTAARAKP